LLPLRSSEARDEFDLSASDNLIAPSLPILFSVLSENDMKASVLPKSLSEVRDEFNLSVSDNLATPSLPISLSME
jgi:hypothetical protein